MTAQRPPLIIPAIAALPAAQLSLLVAPGWVAAVAFTLAGVIFILAMQEVAPEIRRRILRKARPALALWLAFCACLFIVEVIYDPPRRFQSFVAAFVATLGFSGLAVLSANMAGSIYEAVRRHRVGQRR